MKVVIKVGSQAILSAQGEILEALLIDIIRQISTLQQQGAQVVLVSSGAVALGRAISQRIAGRSYAGTVADKQLLASIGQPRLMAIYASLCEKHGIIAAQLLLTKYDFHTKRSYSNILRLLQKALSQTNLLTIINENDSVAVDELMFTDNDELSGIIAAQIGADKLLLLTSIDGVYDKNPEDPTAKLISVLRLQDRLPELSGAKTALGRGGMSSKLNTARKMASVGVMPHIANINEPDVILRLVNGDNSIGSRVIPKHKEPARKKFLAFAQASSSAQIIINAGLLKVLNRGQTCISILPVGIEKFTGDFRKGDLLDILGPDGRKIGVGVARYNAATLREYIGGKNQPALIHYDYLHLNYDAIPKGLDNE